MTFYLRKKGAVNARVVEIRPPPIVSARRSSRLVEEDEDEIPEDNALQSSGPPPRVRLRETPLVSLARAGDLGGVRRLLAKEGADPNEPTDDEAR